MKRTMVKYTVKPDQAAANEALIRAVYEQLRETQLAGLGYATAKLPDGVTFVHQSSIEHEDGSNLLFELQAFKAFQNGIRERCSVAPVVTALEEIDSFRFYHGAE